MGLLRFLNSRQRVLNVVFLTSICWILLNITFVFYALKSNQVQQNANDIDEDSDLYVEDSQDQNDEIEVNEDHNDEEKSKEEEQEQSGL